MSPTLIMGLYVFALAAIVGLGLAGCAHAGADRLIEAWSPGTWLGAPSRYAVYVPPGFRSDERLPLVVLLHGAGNDERTFARSGVAAALDAAIEAGKVPRVVILLPRGDDGFWIDWYDHSRRYEAWILGELIPAVSRRYHTLPCPSSCHVMGVSMGGYGALRFALRYPRRFASATALSSPIFDTEQMLAIRSNPFLNAFVPMERIFGPVTPRARIARWDPFLRWQTPDDLRGIRLRLGWATDDGPGIRKGNARLVKHLRAAGIPVEVDRFAGHHGWAAWTPAILDSLRAAVAGTTPRAAVVAPDASPPASAQATGDVAASATTSRSPSNGLVSRGLPP